MPDKNGTPSEPMTYEIEVEGKTEDKDLIIGKFIYYEDKDGNHMLKLKKKTNEPATLLAKTFEAFGWKPSLEDMISDIKTGYLIKGTQGSHSSNQETGDYSIVGNPAFRIEDGNLVGAVHGLMLAGNAFEFIKKAGKVGSDVRAHLSNGGGSIIGPSVQFSDIQVVAKAD